MEDLAAGRAALDQVPIFVKACSIIPMGRISNTWLRNPPTH